MTIGRHLQRMVAGFSLCLPAMLPGALLSPERLTAGEADKPPHKTFAEILKDRPVPDLATLAARSRPNIGGTEATESFYDLFNLRTRGDERAVPVLGQILAENLASGHRIHGYAAAQALFCIGTPPAHKLLAEHLLGDRYSAGLGIGYASHWSIDSAQATAFIEQYHLKNLTDKLHLKLAVATDDAAPPVNERVSIVLTVKNVSAEPLRMEKQGLSDELFHFQDVATGKFLMESPRTHCKDAPKWIKLPADGTQTVELKIPANDLNELWYPSDAVPPGGRVRIYALLEVFPQFAHRNDTPTAKVWRGRAVSNPVEVRLPGD